MSRPTWARGLKLLRRYQRRQEPHVAPHVGAWIETSVLWYFGQTLLSRPTWARGLKPQDLRQEYRAPRVAPHVGAWIETLLPRRWGRCVGSRPTWARGLKPALPVHDGQATGRAPRGRVD